MRIIGVDADRGSTQARKLIAELSQHEWDILQRAAGLPYDKRSIQPPMTIDITPVEKNTQALYELGCFRPELGKLMKRYDALAERIDAALEK